MAIQVREISERFAAEITEFEIRDATSETEREVIQRALDKYSVLVFREQSASDEEQVVFSRHFGRLQGSQVGVTRETGTSRKLRSELSDAGNVDAAGRVREAGDRNRMATLQARVWHTDRPFMPNPATYSLLMARAVPTVGGETQFADMRAAYDSLPDHLKSVIDDLVVEHDTFHYRAATGFTDFSAEERSAYTPMHRPLVRQNPRTGRKSLYLSAHASRVVGWPVSEGIALLYHLTDLATEREFVYSHTWRLGDAVMWDNLCTMHRSRPHFPESEPRDLRRTSME